MKFLKKKSEKLEKKSVEPEYGVMEEMVPELTFVPEEGIAWYPPVSVSATQIALEILNKDNIERAISFSKNLEPDDYVEYLINFYEKGIERFGENWIYADIVTLLQGLGEIIKPVSYLEIGVRRGRSVSALASNAPDCDLYMFDKWSQNYAGMENPGPELVNRELDKVEHEGERHFINGNSHITLKNFFKGKPGLNFDIMTVDGDHSYDGAAEDMCDVLPKLKVGGAVVFDDISHPKHLYLYDLWNEMVGTNPRFSSWDYRDIGYGVGVGIRKW